MIGRARLLALAAVLLAGCSSPGDRCRSDSDCSGSLVCFKFEGDDGGLSESGVCTHPGAGPNGFCRASADCAEGLCSNELPSATKQRDGRCIPLREAGETCASSDACHAPLECLLSAPDDGVCAVPPAPDGGAAGDAAAAAR